MVSSAHSAAGSATRLQLPGLFPPAAPRGRHGTFAQGLAQGRPTGALHSSLPLPGPSPGSTVAPCLSPCCRRTLRPAPFPCTHAAGCCAALSSAESPSVHTATAESPSAPTARPSPVDPHRRSAPVRTAGPAPAAVVLGIESSCDDTGVAVVSSDGRVLGEALATQADIHSQWGGVVPNLARDAHAAAIDRTVDIALAAAGLRPQQLSAIAVTVGPGLGLCLRVGAAKARDLARQYGIPLVSIHHMEAHALVARLPPAAAAAAPPAVRLAATRGSPVAPAEGSTAAGGQPVILLREPQRQDQQQGQDEQQQHGQQQSCDQERGQLANAQSPDYSPQAEQQREQVRAEGQPTCCAAAASLRTPTRPAGQDSDQPPADGAGTSGAETPPPPPLDAAAVAADVAGCASLPFPFLCLLVSGGHNLLVLVRGVGDFVQLGTTVDDALGEAYDKVARLLELELRPHGGAALEALAREGDPAALRFAVPMRKYATCDFSFAGLKTSTRLAIEQRLRPELTEAMAPGELRRLKADIAASFQAVAVQHLAEKTRRGVAWARELAPGLQHLVVAGGVACNAVVRAALQQLAEAEGLELLLPPPRWCTDNGVMAAWAGIERIACGWAEPPPPALTQPAAHPATAAAAADAEASIASCSVPVDGAGGGARAAAGPGPGAAEAGAAGTGAGAEWIELKPRWPLTSALHPRIAAARREERRSVKRVRMHTALSDLTPPAVAVGVAPAAAGNSAATGAAPAAVRGAFEEGPDASVGSAAIGGAAAAAVRGGDDAEGAGRVAALVGTGLAARGQ